MVSDSYETLKFKSPPPQENFVDIIIDGKILFCDNK